jgi:hypothetical protein
MAKDRRAKNVASVALPHVLFAVEARAIGIADHVREILCVCEIVCGVEADVVEWGMKRYRGGIKR